MVEDELRNIPTKRRNPWIAAILGVVVPGMGHMYVGQLKRGIILFSLYTIIAFVLILLMLVLPFAPLNLILPFLLVLSIYLYIVREAYLIARNLNDTYQLKSYNNIYKYILVFVLALILSESVKGIVKAYVTQAFRIPSGAMEDTILIGDYIMVSKYSYWTTDPQPGDIIVFPYPSDPSQDFIKRVIAVSGQSVEIRDKIVYVDGEPFSEASTVKHMDQTVLLGRNGPRDNWGPKLIPDGKLFVLGDNRDNSSDSRFWGYVDVSAVKGKVALIYWSQEYQAGAPFISWRVYDPIGSLIQAVYGAQFYIVRWDRLGKYPL